MSDALAPDEVIEFGDDTPWRDAGAVLAYGFTLSRSKFTMIKCDNDLPKWMIRLERAPSRMTELAFVYMSQETHRALIIDQDLEIGVLDQVDEHIVEWMEGPNVRAVVKDGGRFAEAARREAEQEKAAVVDAVDALRRDADTLVQQVAEMRRQPSMSQMQLFGQRLGELRDRHDELKAIMAQIQGALDFAAVAIVDASSLPRK